MGGRIALLGSFVLARDWPAIYGLVTVFAAGVGLGFGLAASSWPSRRLAAVIVGGWLGEYLVLASGLLADELNFLNAAYFWLLATAGPIQPIAAWLGAAVGRRLARQRQAPS